MPERFRDAPAHVSVASRRRGLPSRLQSIVFVQHFTGYVTSRLTATPNILSVHRRRQRQQPMSLNARIGKQSTEVHMIPRNLILIFVAVASALPLHAEAADPVEPNAGNWRTWVISSGRDYRVPPPPGAAETQAELRALADLVSHNDAQAQQQIAVWNAGAPAYRWIDLLNARTLAGITTTTNGRT